MYRYKVIDIHPDDSYFNARGERRLKAGDVIQSEFPSMLEERTEENTYDPEKHGWFFGELGGRVFHCIKVIDITNEQA